MENRIYQQFVGNLKSLNSQQSRHLKEQLNLYDDQKRTAITLCGERPEQCPHCTSQRFIRWSVRSDIQRYKCKECNKTFNGLTGTPLARLRKKGRWIEFSSCLVEACSVREAAKRCQVNKSTAFKWRHRFMQIPKTIAPNALSGIVEVKETHFAYSQKGTRNKPTDTDLQQKTTKQARPKQVCVVIARDRNLNTFDQIQESSKSLYDKLLNRLSKDILLCSETQKLSDIFGQRNGTQHSKADLQKSGRGKTELIHTRNVSFYIDNLKLWLKRFRGIATKYLSNYLGWFRNLDEFNMKPTKTNILLRAKCAQIYHHQPLTTT